MTAPVVKREALVEAVKIIERLMRYDCLWRTAKAKYGCDCSSRLTHHRARLFIRQQKKQAVKRDEARRG